VLRLERRAFSFRALCDGRFNWGNGIFFMALFAVVISLGGIPMKTKLVLTAALLTWLVTPVLAADEFYIVQDSTTKKCTIVSQKPTTTTTTVVGNNVFKTRTEAENGMKTSKVCVTK
jgi:hypothetical protein